MKRNLMVCRVICGVLACSFCAAPAVAVVVKGLKAQRKAMTRPSTKPILHADKVTVVSVKGIAQKRLTSNPKAKWIPVKVGDVLGVPTVLRTGLGSRVVLRLGDRGMVTVKSATKVGIGQFKKVGKLLKARLGLKYGSMRSRVERARGPNDFRISTAVGTLSVRGSEGDTSFWGDSGAHHRSTQSIWRMAFNGGEQDIPPGQEGDDNGTRWFEQTRRDYSTDKGDPHGGLSQDEKDELDQNGGIGGDGGLGDPTGVTGGSGGTTEPVAPSRGRRPPGRRQNGNAE